MTTSLKSKLWISGFGFLGLIFWTLVGVYLAVAFIGMRLDTAIGWGIGFVSLTLVFGGLMIGVSQLAQSLAERFISRLQPASRSTEDRLDELEHLKRRDMVTPEEYTAKRQDILKDL
jgi:hypothetical protein